MTKCITNNLKHQLKAKKKKKKKKKKQKNKTKKKKKKKKNEESEQIAEGKISKRTAQKRTKLISKLIS